MFTYQFPACLALLASLLMACEATTPADAADVGSGGDDLGVIGDATGDATPDTLTDTGGSDGQTPDIWAKDTADADPGGCPAEPAIGQGGCTKPGLTCNYGQECCCGKCYPSTVCSCNSDGTWACYATDACMIPPDSCGDTSGGDTSPGSCGSDAECAKGEFCQVNKFACGGTGACAKKPDACPAIYMPVCGCDNKTYGNECEAASAGANVAKNGACPDKCNANADCQGGQFCSKPAATCAGVGLCSPYPDACDAMYAPVCGCDGKTYSNACAAALQGVNVGQTGACKP